jgi:multidrug efflux pump subunit AcrB
MNMMRDFVDDEVRTRMERVPGVSQIELWGGAERQIQILVDPAKLAQRGVTLTELREAVRERNQDVSGGDVDSGKRRYLLRTVGRFDSVEGFGELILRQDGDAVTRLRDVATVELGHFEIRSRSSSGGVPSLTLAVRRETGSNVIAIRAALLPVVERLRTEVLEPVGLDIRLVSDDVRYVEASVANVWQNLAIGAVLATAVMFIFLRSVPATLVGVCGIPVCTVAAFIGLLVAGRTINVISLAGVAFAIGMTLDNTIVVLENIERERMKGKRGFEAALAGARAVWPAVLASTLTTVFVFAPVLFVQQEAGQLYSDIAIAISAAILVSMVTAMTVVPAACARLPFREREGRGEAWAPFKGPILGFVGWMVGSAWRRAVCLVVTVGVALGAIVFLTPPAEYLPEGEEAKTFALLIAPPGYSLAEMSDIAAEIEAEFAPYLDDDPGEFARGESEVPGLMMLIVGVGPESMRVISETKDPGQIEALMEILTERFRRYPGMRSFASRGSIISSNDGGTRSVNLDISGPELAPIYETALKAYRLAEEVLDDPQINSEPSSLVLGQPLVEVRPRWERAAELGFSAEEIGYAVASLSDGAYVDEFFLADDKIDVFLYSTAGTGQELGRLADLPVATPTGAVVPVRSVADLVETVDTDAIRRVNGSRTVTLNVVPPRSVALETAVEIVQRDVVDALRAGGEIPEGVGIDISGASDQLNETREALGGNFLVSVVLSYLLLVVIFRHWGYPWIIMATVPLGIAGGIFGLWFLNAIGISQPFDMITMLGFLILLGTVVNNPILIVDLALENYRVEGMSAADAVREAVAARLRPILMTTITTICGLSPLVFIPGAGTELYRGVGAIVLFGLLFSTLVALTFLPALLTMVLEWLTKQRTPGGAAAA